MAKESGPDFKRELAAMEKVVTAVAGLEKDQQTSVLRWAADRLQLGSILPAIGTHPAGSLGATPPGGTGSMGAMPQGPPSSKPTAKEWMIQKKPNSDVERVTCLGVYLTRFGGEEIFNTKQLTAINRDAKQPPVGNPSQAVDNATKLQYLAIAGSGKKQVTPRGEALVDALPDREAVKRVLQEHPIKKRRGRKAAAKKAR